ncbi:helix-turn-helix domain-containing protein [Nocardia sp. NPDC004415]
MDAMTVAEAATALGVRPRQVQRLVAAGHLTVSRKVGRSVLVDTRSVLRRKRMDSRQGRPWTQTNAWAAIVMLSNGVPRWITAAQRGRITHRLATASPDDLAQLTRNRADVRRFRCHPSLLPELERDLILTGASALSGPDADLLGLTPSYDSVDGYSPMESVAELVRAYVLTPDPAGQVTIRAVAEERAFVGGRLPAATIALDLAESLNTREQAAGTAQLARLLDIAGRQ